MRPAFDDVLGGFGTDTLLEGMAGRHLVHRTAACGVAPETLFSLEALQQLLLQGGVSADDLRITVKGHVPNLDAFGILRDGRLRPLVLRQLTRQGVSIVINNLHRYVPRLWALATDAERVLRDSVVVGAIASFSREPALPLHYDPEDLIIVQVEGSKIWRFFGDSTDCGVASHRGLKPPPKELSATFVMHPGDILFVPAGLHHQCETADVSLHLGILIKHATMPDLLRDLCSEHPSLNRPLRPMLGEEALREQAAAFRSEVTALLDKTDIADWLALRNGARACVTQLDLRPPSGSASASTDAVAVLAVTMTEGARRGRRWKIGGIEFEPSAGALAALAALRDGPRPIGALIDSIAADLGSEEARAGLDQLAAKGIVRIDERGRRAGEAGPPTS